MIKLVNIISEIKIFSPIIVSTEDANDMRMIKFGDLTQDEIHEYFDNCYIFDIEDKFTFSFGLINLTKEQINRIIKAMDKNHIPYTIVNATNNKFAFKIYKKFVVTQ